MARLTSKQEMFCREYLTDLNAKQAAIRAGYSEKTAEQQSYQLLQKTLVVNRISELKEKRNDRVQVDSDYVLNRLIEIDKMDVLDILGDNGELKPISEWPESWRRYLSGFDLLEQYIQDAETDERQVTKAVLKKIKWPDKVKNLEMLGRHTTVGAWKERIDHNHKIIDDGTNEW